MRSIVQFAPREQQLSTIDTKAEAGFFAGRHCRLPADWPSPLLKFMAPSPARPAPRPSAASRPMPRSPRSAA